MPPYPSYKYTYAPYRSLYVAGYNSAFAPQTSISQFCVITYKLYELEYIFDSADSFTGMFTIYYKNPLFFSSPCPNYPYSFAPPESSLPIEVNAYNVSSPAHIFTICSVPICALLVSSGAKSI